VPVTIIGVLIVFIIHRVSYGLVLLTVIFLGKRGLITFIDDFRDNRAVITNIYIAANDGRVGCMAILIGGPIINVGIIRKIVHDKISDIDEEFHVFSPS